MKFLRSKYHDHWQPVRSENADDVGRLCKIALSNGFIVKPDHMQRAWYEHCSIINSSIFTGWITVSGTDEKIWKIISEHLEEQ